MKAKPNKVLLTFLAILCFVNLMQGYFTELLADEAYYWVYSNFLDWGYFDHPPMVAIWISISKFFISSGELSVRFFSAFTLSLTFYIVWLLISHPKKKDYTWLFVLIVLSTSLFNVYGFVTVPDTPLMLFVAIFLYGYKLYLDKKSLLSYVILAVSMAGMMYSKYQAVLVIGFVILSNFKLLTDYKLWITVLIALGLFFPHLYWQIENEYPSFKYHLFERKTNTAYRFRDTYMHLINTIAIIGFTFPVVYKALFKNLKNKDLFNRSLNFIAVGFIVFFFISTFKGHAQAQWIVPISIPLIVITFNFLVTNQQNLKLFKTLAFITLGITVIARLIMAIDGLLPHKLEMHGNKKWVNKLEAKLAETQREPLFLNSYQKTSLYWFYSGKRPCQYNAWSSRKNQYDLLDCNKNCRGERMLQIGAYKGDPNATMSITYGEGKLIKLVPIDNYEKVYNTISFYESPTIKNNSYNEITVAIANVASLSKNDYKVVLKSDKGEVVMCKATIKNKKLSFKVPDIAKDFKVSYIQVIAKINPKTIPVRVSLLEKCHFIR